MRSPAPRNLVHLHRDRGYRFADRDPMLEFICNDITDSGLKLSFIAERSGVSPGTLYNWTSGKTKRPQNEAVEAVLNALGWERPLVAKNMAERARRA